MSSRKPRPPTADLLGLAKPRPGSQPVSGGHLGIRPRLQMPPSDGGVRRNSSRACTGRSSSSAGPVGGKKTKQMDTDPVEYWNAQARHYDDNIFSTIDEDLKGVILRTIERFSSQDEGPFGRCIDLGCGAGKYLPALASRFRSVSAYDLSPKLVSLAKAEVECKDMRNVEVCVRDLAQVWYREGQQADFGHREEMESYGFAVMANVLIAPVTEGMRMLMLRNALRSLCIGGRLLAVVPSLESALYVNMRCDEVNYEGPYGGSRSAENGEVTRLPSRSEGADLLRGIIKRTGARTKHYLEPEFQLLAARVGFTIEACEKVEYSWRSELGLPSDLYVPDKLQTPPLPWDWLFVLLRGEPTALPRGSVPPSSAREHSCATGDRCIPPVLPQRETTSTLTARTPRGGLQSLPALPYVGALGRPEAWPAADAARTNSSTTT